MPRWLPLVARIVTIVPILIGIACLIGWVFDIDVLICIGPGLAAMNINTAIGLILVGAGQLAWLSGKVSARSSDRPTLISASLADRLVLFFGCCVAVIAALTLLEYALGHDFGIDNLLIADHETMTAPAAMSTGAATADGIPMALGIPGRMSIATALALLAFSLTMISEQMLFIWAALCIAGFTLICYFLDLHALARLTALDMAIHTGISFMLLGAGRVLGRGQRGMMHLLLADGLGGAMARTMLPVAILAPVAVSWLAGFSQRNGLLDSNIAAALGAILGIILLVTMVYVTGRALAGAELRRRRAELELRLSHNALEAKVRERTLELRQARDEANGANRHKSVFLAHMSHELRTPLNAILGFADIMRREQFGPVGQPRYIDYAADIHNSGSHLLALINDILDLSKIEAGKYEFAPQPLDATALVHACHDLVAGLAKERHLRFLVEVDTHLPAITVDERAIKQILINLLSNAIKFTPAGGAVTLTVAAARHAALPGEHLIFTVTDTGIGMTVHEIATAQTPFGQIQNQFSRTHKGTGLGLFLAKQLTELQSGRLEIDSQPGLGTTIRVRLPLHPPADTGEEPARVTA